jgi:hypothetical protein
MPPRPHWRPSHVARPKFGLGPLLEMTWLARIAQSRSLTPETNTRKSSMRFPPKNPFSANAEFYVFPDFYYHIGPSPSSDLQIISNDCAHMVLIRFSRSLNLALLCGAGYIV